MGEPLEFHKDIWHQQTRILWVSCGFVSMILSVVIVMQYWHVTDTETDRQTQTHDDSIYHTSIASCGSN